MATISPAISPAHAVVYTVANDFLSVGADGTVERTLGRLPTAIAGEVDSLDVSPDGQHVLISVVNDHDEACAATVFSIGPDRMLHRLLDGAAASFSPDGRRLAYLRYTRDGKFCYRTHMVVRQLATGAETVAALPGGRRLEGTPPEWPLNWSPDGAKLTYVAGTQGASVITVGGQQAVALHGAATAADTSPLAPVFLDNDSVAAMTNCCVGAEQRVTQFSLTGGPASRLFAVPSPVRSIRRDRGGNGLWLTTEQSANTLWHWDGHQLRPVPVAALVTSG